MSAKNVLILSWNAIPSINNNVPVSATGMRAYKLALGLVENGISGVDVAVRNDYAKLKGKVDGRVGLIEWHSNGQITKDANQYRALIISGNYGDPTVNILKRVRPGVVKVVDAFIPYYFEDVYSRESREEANWLHRKKVFDLHQAFSLADYILVANKNQKEMYLGALGATNMLNYSNLFDYRDNFIICPPGLIGESEEETYNPYESFRNIIGNRKIVMWYGSAYAWYDIKPLLDAYQKNINLKDKSILFVLGAKNPNFESPRIEADEFEQADQSIIFVPWVAYNERLNWLRHADLGVSINKPTVENSFSFRNRLLDFAEANLQFITNGDDPLGEEMITAGFAHKFNLEDIVPTILRHLNVSSRRASVKTRSKVLDVYDNKACNRELSHKVLERNQVQLKPAVLVKSRPPRTHRAYLRVRRTAGRMLKRRKASRTR